MKEAQMVDAAIAYAAEIGFAYEYGDLRPYGREAICHIPSQTIYMQPGLLACKERSLAWHEIAHAVLGHEPTMFEHLNRRQELAADEWASHMLIDHGEYALAEEKFGANTEWIAQELCVLEKIVVAYERTLLRIGDEVIVNARLGRGQWTQKLEAV